MTRLPLATGALFAACALPAGLVLGLAMLVPNDGRRWVVCFVALALALTSWCVIASGAFVLRVA
ncbi:hypothetical protein PUR61_28095 [Streptomyces sp. BE20]|uniref:hypothetical protein n=1 Tax=Streptomyces sp. BE20 TaxID=3002525 RepID=UPI002E7710C3|nr:hypothetical protein [Streptomyces sp. BE20]MEE1826026.1 hypothetical protein [Streptomyces sp. BE20]